MDALSVTQFPQTPEATGGCAEAVTRWLLTSGIYVLTPADPNRGAVYSHYDRSLKRHELVYAEATGYAMSLLRFLQAARSDEELIRHARASGDWLIRWTDSHAGVVALGIDRGRDVREAYAFDNGICCRGLLDLYELTEDEKYLRGAERIADWLVYRAMRDDGSVRPVFDPDAGRFEDRGALWYRRSGSFHAKIGMPLLRLGAHTGDRRYRDAAMKVYGWAVGQQRPDGAFPVHDGARVVNLHFHFYTIEALLYAYAWQGIPRFLEAAERAAEWALGMQRPDGSLPVWQGGGFLATRGSDVQAQAVRIFSLVSMIRPHRRLLAAAASASAALRAMQLRGGDPREDGGFLGGEGRKYRLIPAKTPRMTSWSAMFAVQALALERRIGDGDAATAARFLF